MVTRFTGGARVETHFGPFTVKTDQPPNAGGDGSAPTPFQTFLASLGSCAGFYVLAFCRQRSLPVEGIRIVQSMDVDPETHRVIAVHLDIHVPPEFPAKYRDALVRAAEQCTVKKHLEAPPRFMVATFEDSPEHPSGDRAVA